MRYCPLTPFRYRRDGRWLVLESPFGVAYVYKGRSRVRKLRLGFRWNGCSVPPVLHWWQPPQAPCMTRHTDARTSAEWRPTRYSWRPWCTMRGACIQCWRDQDGAGVSKGADSPADCGRRGSCTGRCGCSAWRFGINPYHICKFVLHICKYGNKTGIMPNRHLGLLPHLALKSTVLMLFSRYFNPPAIFQDLAFNLLQIRHEQQPNNDGNERRDERNK
jgi:hypothetical protein